jgi:TFIIF-interacting CTD phosphatase-like protein
MFIDFFFFMALYGIIVALKIFQQAQILGKADEERLLKDRKLVLLVDLDQTLIHTTNDNIPNNLKVKKIYILIIGEGFSFELYSLLMNEQILRLRRQIKGISM